MNANQIKQLTLRAKNQLISEKETSWLSISKYIYNEIEKSALLGKSEVIINLNDDTFSQLKNKDFDFVKEKIESEGFVVNYISKKSLFDKKEILINW